MVVPLHKAATAVNWVHAPVVRFHAVVVDVRQGEFAEFGRCLGVLGGPVPKRDRNPCDTAPILSFRSSVPVARCVGSGPVGDRNEKSPPWSSSGCASPGTVSAREDRGTRCV